MPENHPLFPSGDWDGFYTYSYGPTAKRCQMPSMFTFEAGKITGSGNDEVGFFNWQGTYDLSSLSCRLTKTYPSHSVEYLGNADENGIWGTWEVSGLKGGFHLWPRENSQVVEKKVVKELPEVVFFSFVKYHYLEYNYRSV